MAEPAQRPLVVPIAIAATVGVLAGVAPGLLLNRPPPSTAAPIARPTPSVITAVRELARLEGATAHVERVIELTDTQEHLFGLVHGDDSILLVAAADVTAGVDLAALTPASIDVDDAHARVRITLPRAAVLTTAIDEAHTYVHARTTDLLAARREDLETLARREAHDTLERAAVEGGLLDRADRSAARTVEALARSLGYHDVQVTTAR
jgi:hypothetical protein